MARPVTPQAAGVEVAQIGTYSEFGKHNRVKSENGTHSTPRSKHCSGAIVWSSLQRFFRHRSVLGLCAGRCRHGHVGVRDVPHVAARDRRGLPKGAWLHGDHERPLSGRPATRS